MKSLAILLRRRAVPPLRLARLMHLLTHKFTPLSMSCEKCTTLSNILNQGCLQTRSRKREEGENAKNTSPTQQRHRICDSRAETYCRFLFKADELFVKASCLREMWPLFCVRVIYTWFANSWNLILKEAWLFAWGCEARLSFTFARSYFTFFACLRRRSSDFERPCFTWQGKEGEEDEEEGLIVAPFVSPFVKRLTFCAASVILRNDLRLVVGRF